jgi:hypothetical protein
MLKLMGSATYQRVVRVVARLWYKDNDAVLCTLQMRSIFELGDEC